MSEAADLSIEQIYIGDIFSFEVPISEELINTFVGVSGDESPIHIDKEFAQQHSYPQRVAHGALICAFFSRLIGMYCPGRLAILHSLNVRFHHATHPDDILKIEGVVDQVSEGAKTIVLLLTASNTSTGEIHVKGKAQVGFLE